MPHRHHLASQGLVNTPNHLEAKTCNSRKAFWSPDSTGVGASNPRHSCEVHAEEKPGICKKTTTDPSTHYH